VPPAEPPPNDILPGSAFMSATRSSSVLYGDCERTAIASASVVREAIGVVFERSTDESLVWIAPSITSPITISSFDWPERLDASWLSPMVPPAPGTL
jgi:hypothetical protein